MKNKYLNMTILFLGLFSVLSGSGKLACGLETTEIHGRVTGVDRVPVPGADVLVFDSENTRRPADFSSARTGSDGLYRVLVPPGKYWMVAVFRANGALFGPLGLNDKHSGDPLPVNAEKGKSLQVDFTVRDLQDAAKEFRKQNSHLLSFSGKVIDAHGRPRSLVYVVADQKIIQGEVPAFISPWTDEDGRFSLYLPAGEYQLGVADAFPPKHYLTLSAPIKIEKAVLDFEMRLPGE